MPSLSRVLVLTVAVLLSGCAGSSGGGGHRRDADPYEQAIRLQGTGDCARAAPLFQSLAVRGRGYEMAQYNLGECLLDLARSATSPAAAARQRAQAATWIVKAANSDLAVAQEAAERLYLDGVGVAADPVEAGKWALLFLRNPLRLEVGPVAPDPTLETRLSHRLTAAQWRQARLRADQWAPVDQPVTPQRASTPVPPA